MAPVNPFDPQLLDELQIGLTYAKLFPTLTKDFMGKQDCRSVHGPGNMQAETQGSPVKQSGPVIHLTFQGGNDVQSQAKKAKYKTAVETGDLDYVLEALGN
jgi:hypothetical protein